MPSAQIADLDNLLPRAGHDLVVEAVESMSRRLKKPKQSPVQLAELMTRGHHLPRFGACGIMNPAIKVSAIRGEPHDLLA